MKRALDRVLFRSTLTYRLGAVGRPEPGLLLVEFTSDAVWKDLAPVLRSVEHDLGIHLEALGWGWAWTAGRGQEPSRPDWLRDPCAAAQAQAEETRIYGFGRRPLVRLASLLAVTLVLALVILLERLWRPFPEWVPVGSMAAWVLWSAALFAFGPNLFTYPYVSWVRCDPEGLVVKYLFRRDVRRLRWSQVEALEVDLARNLMVVFSGRETLKIPIDPFAGALYRDTLIKTVVERAELLFVEGIPLRGATYRREQGTESRE